MKSGNFIVAMVIIHEIFSLTHPLSVALLSKQTDLASAIDMTENLNDLLQKMRVDADEKFSEIFSTAIELASDIESSISMPRTVSRQTHRENYVANDTEEYYRRSIFIPFLDHFISHLNQRFTRHRNVLRKIQNVLPKFIINLDEESCH